MTMPSSGALNMGGTSSPVSVNYELGQSLTATVSMNDANVRTLAGVGGSGTTWSMNSLYGKQRRLTATVTISASTVNYIANTAKVSGYIAGATDVTFVINSGVVVGSSSTGSYAFTVNTSWAAGDTVSVINNGTVIGASGYGGAGGNDVDGASIQNGSPGAGGGPAVLVQRTILWTNTSGVAGGGAGGGGGGGSGIPYFKAEYYSGGGGGGGGRGYYAGNGGTGGTSVSAGYEGGNGGNGSSSAGGAGGTNSNSGYIGGAGGAGGALASSGSTGGTGGTSGGGGGTGGAGGGAGSLLYGKSYVNSGTGISGGTYAGYQSG